MSRILSLRLIHAMHALTSKDKYKYVNKCITVIRQLFFSILYGLSRVFYLTKNCPDIWLQLNFPNNAPNVLSVLPYSYW